jgi:bifunctional N-acetylglucosamine-1-phosphate-uridyltransferase/glucosamine-1-phosphate-acetyltransferase GlmU-like protein
MDNNNLSAIILAGGKGVRMQSEIPKVLHPISGKPMIFYTLEKLFDMGIQNIVVVVGYKAEEVKQSISKQFNVQFAFQPEQLGTADAVKMAMPFLGASTDKVLVLNGDDSAFYSRNTLTDFIASHEQNNLPISAITAMKPDASTIGRVIRNPDGSFSKILEFNEYVSSGLQSMEINCGAYIFNIKFLKENLPKVQMSQKGEYYLTELLNLTQESGGEINLFELQNLREWQGINTREELLEANKSS